MKETPIKIITITNGQSVLLSECDYPYLSQFTWGLSPCGYAQSNALVDGKRTTVTMHREILQPPTGMWSGHRNRNKLDNTRKNLRIVTPKESAINRPSLLGEKNPFWKHHHTTVTRIKIGLASAKPIIQYDMKGNTLKHWKSAYSCEKELGYSSGNISSVCLGKRKSAHGFIWRYL